MSPPNDRSIPSSSCHPPSSTATLSGSISPEDDPRVSAALEVYLARLRRGERPDRAAFLDEYADLAEVLAPCLDGLELVHTAARDLPLEEAVAELPDVGLPPASRLGDYRILREVGRGGMGIVYEAEQVSLGRRVALKVLPLASALDPRQLQRFRIEAQAAALLHHPHIVPVYAVGSDRGLHYYAMQFIHGPTLADIIRDLASSKRAEAAIGTSSIPTAAGLSSQGRDFARAAARLGQQAAEALDHAHSLGVLHRDVKPSNLMVDPQGDLWITDFGLARVASESDLTRTGDLLGTLRYISPEQAGGRSPVDHRADIYSLGVTLYELLTLRPAFHAADRHALLRSITQDEPPGPRRVDPSIPRDLETIVLKAMAKEPASRYRSARELAEDLARFRSDRSIQARRPGPLELVARWSRRHRPAVVTSTIVALLTLGVAAGLLWVEKRRTQLALDDLKMVRARERKAIDVMLSKVDQQLIYPLMGKAAYGGLLAGPEGRQTYEEAIRFYTRVAEIFAADPETRPIAAHANRRIGFFQKIIQDPRADESYRRSIQIFESVLAEQPSNSSCRASLMSVLQEFLGWLVDTGRSHEAGPYLGRVLELAESMPRPASNAGLERNRAANELNNVAWWLSTRAGREGREPERVAAIAREAVALLPGFPGFWNTLALAEYRAGDLERAEAAIRQSMELSRQGGVVHDWVILAMIRQAQGNPADARKWLDRTRDWIAAHPDEVDGDLRLLDAEASQRLGVAPIESPASPP
jgi:serine/threonine protein kinase